MQKKSLHRQGVELDTLDYRQARYLLSHLLVVTNPFTPIYVPQTTECAGFLRVHPCHCALFDFRFGFPVPFLVYPPIFSSICVRNPTHFPS